MKTNTKRISKLMSLILRHQPSVIGAKLDENGWLDVDELIEGINKKGIRLTMDSLMEVVETNDKKRFAFNEDQTRIRANQGHSVEVNVQLKEAIPPATLYHGTVEKFLHPILKDGLKPMSRLHVHLSADLETATKVGSRRGKPVILKVDTESMLNDKHVFYLSENGVWLTDVVPSEYISR